MPSYNNFQTDYIKNVDTINLSKKPKDNQKDLDFSEERRRKIIDWVTFYRRNIHRFIQHYFGISLHPYQIIWVYEMAKADSYVAICSRAVGKSWLLALFACARAVLYPNSEIVIVSSTKDQAGVIVGDKITSLRDSSYNLAREIRNITTNMNKWSVEFFNGSVIKVVASRDSSRGKRSTFTIYEEFRLIDKEVLDSVIRPFAYIRQVPYLKDPRYQHLIEEPKEVFISSAYHKGLWWFDETRKNIKAMLRGENSGFMALDLGVAIRHKIKTKSQIKREISKMDEITVLEEYLNIPWGESSTSYFKLKMFNRARTVPKAFYPQRAETYNPKKNPYAIEKKSDEIRILSCDIAQRSGSKNDLSITSCIRLLATHKGYYRELSFLEAYSGENVITQGLRIKQLFLDFEADAIVLDIQNAGITVYDQLGVITKDPERDIEHPAMTIMQHPSIDDDTYQELSRRTLALNAKPCIYVIAGTAKLNSDIAVEMRDKLQKKLWGFLYDESKGEDYLFKNNKELLKSDDISAKAFFLAPYVQTSLMVNESINLSYTLVAGNIKLSEPPGNRKDRYTSLAYGNYYASQLDKELLKESNTGDSWDAIQSVTFVM